MNSIQADAAADAAARAQHDFRSKHWAYFGGRDRPHPLTGAVPPRNRALDRQMEVLVERNRAAQRAAEQAVWFERRAAE